MDNLALRDMTAADFPAYSAMLSDFEVVKMSISHPWPPEPTYIRQRFEQPNEAQRFVKVITENGQFAGQIGLTDGELGYLLAQPFWGRGIATWAVRQILAQGFEILGLERIIAGTWEDNPASIAVLKKCGFRKTGEEVLYCKPRGRAINGPDFKITRADWEAKNG